MKGARPHRFRHTLATEILARGYTEQDVADIRGVSAAVVHKHYAKWSQARQERVERVIQAVHPDAFGEKSASNPAQNPYSHKKPEAIN